MPIETQLPLYKCHKEVRAGKIMSISKREDGIPGVVLTLENPWRSGQPSALVPVTDSWCDRFKPEIGGYFVQYELQPGETAPYTSFSPASAFESGYTLV